MANNLTRTPWIIDTAAASTFAPYANNPVFVSALTFSGYIAAGAQCTVEDDRGVVAKFTGDADLSPQTITFACPQALIGLKCTFLDSGQLSVFVD